MADEDTQDSFGVVDAMALHNGGKAFFTTASYMPAVGEPASVSRISVRIDRKIGSADHQVNPISLPVLLGLTFVVLVPDFKNSYRE